VGIPRRPVRPALAHQGPSPGDLPTSPAPRGTTYTRHGGSGSDASAAASPRGDLVAAARS